MGEVPPYAGTRQVYVKGSQGRQRPPPLQSLVHARQEGSNVALLELLLEGRGRLV